LGDNEISFQEDREDPRLRERPLGGDQGRMDATLISMDILIYPGGHLMEEWMKTVEKEPRVMADVTDTGFSNSYMAIRWLKECFDPATRGRAGRSRRLLFLDGPDIHTSVEFLEACWDRNIVCIILPAHLSGVFQPLDVDFFSTHSVRSMTDAPSLLLGPSPYLRTLRPLIPPRPSRSSTADFEGT